VLDGWGERLHRHDGNLYFRLSLWRSAKAVQPGQAARGLLLGNDGHNRTGSVEKGRPWLGRSPREQEQNVIVKRTQPLQRGQALFLDRHSGFIAEGGDTGAL
jgi:hypothetical protein